MNEQNPKIDKTCRMSFLFGLFAGIAATSIVVFIFIFVLIMANNKTLAGEQNNTQDTAAVDEQNQPKDPNAEVPKEVQAEPVIPIKEGENIKGNKDAKVEIIEYSDFECPYCAKHFSTMKQIMEEYKDKVKLVFRHFPLSFHANAQKSAEAAECAGEQGKFWEMHDAIFEANLAQSLSLDKLYENAKNLGLDEAKFKDCLDTGKFAAKVNQDMQEGAKAGVTGTPATFINGKAIKGAYPYENIKAEIDAALQAK